MDRSAGDKILGFKFSSERVGDVRIEELLAQGGTSWVYRVQTGRGQAALKILNEQATERASARNRFDQEAKVSAAAGSDAVEVYDYGVLPDDGRQYIIMELIAGETLAAVLEREGCFREWMPAVRIAARVARILEKTNKAKVIHRDVKPGNVMLDRTKSDLRVRLLDFGAAKSRGEYGAIQTLEDDIVGTPGYIPCEVLLGADDINEKVDVFSLGVVLYESLIGELPFPQSTPDERKAMLSSRASRLNEKRAALGLAKVPAALEDIVASALEIEALERPTMKEMAETLERLINAPQAADVDVPADEVTLAPWTPWFLGLAGGAALAVTLGLYLAELHILPTAPGPALETRGVP